ncbi:MAG: transposase [Planctomycetes bacterium]|nr:transposase [Planctomycetota bacterium]
MSQPLVIAYHLIWTAYGWWLPNDPRGSGSKEVCTDVLAELGELHFGRKAVQPPGHEVRRFYEKAAQVLQHPLLSFDEDARAEIGLAFGEVIEEQCYTSYACAIMPDHVHILIRKHKHQAEEMIDVLKEASRIRLCASNHRPADHPTWSTRGGWKVFLEHPDEIRRTIPYIERNPLPLGLPVQRWPFVKEYDGWPLHAGHSPNSPYAKRLREAGRHPQQS